MPDGPEQAQGCLPHPDPDIANGLPAQVRCGQPGSIVKALVIFMVKVAVHGVSFRCGLVKATLGKALYPGNSTARNWALQTAQRHGHRQRPALVTIA